MSRRLSLLLFLACAVLPVQAEMPTTLSGEVVGISDGDTLTLRTAGVTHRIRLALIDAPETGQAFSQVAKQNLARLTFRRDVQAVCSPKPDRYERRLCEVFVGGHSVNRQQIRDGMAWVYRDYVPADMLDVLVDLEKAAQTERLGLWMSPQPVPPWVYRQQRRHSSVAEVAQR